MNYEQLLELLRDSGGSRSIDTPAEAEMRMGSLYSPYGSRSIDTPAEYSLLRGALSGLYNPRMTAIIRGFARGVPSGYGRDDLRASLRGLLGNKEATQAILRGILEQQ